MVRNSTTKKLHQGRGTTGKTAVLGIKDRDTNQVKAKVIDSTERKTLHGYIQVKLEKSSTVCTYDFKSYEKLDSYNHQTFRPRVGKFIDEQNHINGMESFWSTMKRTQKGVYHILSVKHLDRYVHEFPGRHKIRNKDTIVQMQEIVVGVVDKRLTYENPIR